MDANKELHIAASSNQRVTTKLHSGEVIKGVAEKYQPILNALRYARQMV
jgi:hypothetical protein